MADKKENKVIDLRVSEEEKKEHGCEVSAFRRKMEDLDDSTLFGMMEVCEKELDDATAKDDDEENAEGKEDHDPENAFLLHRYGLTLFRDAQERMDFMGDMYVRDSSTTEPGKMTPAEREANAKQDATMANTVGVDVETAWMLAELSRLAYTERLSFPEKWDETETRRNLAMCHVFIAEILVENEVLDGALKELEKAKELTEKDQGPTPVSVEIDVVIATTMLAMKAPNTKEALKAARADAEALAKDGKDMDGWLEVLGQLETDQDEYDRMTADEKEEIKKSIDELLPEDNRDKKPEEVDEAEVTVLKARTRK